MSRPLSPRVEEYQHPSQWGENANGQPRKMFNYGDGLVAVWAPGPKGGEKKEIFRFRYCINGRPSTVHIGDGGLGSFDAARIFSDAENSKVQNERAQQSSLEERAKRIGYAQKSRKMEKKINRGFRNYRDLIAFIAYLRNQDISNQIAMLIILHISTLLDIAQLVCLKHKDVIRNNGAIYFSVFLNSRNRKARNQIQLINYARNSFSKFEYKIQQGKPDEYLFNDLRDKSLGELQDLVDVETHRSGIEYRVDIDDLRNEFVNRFSRFGLIEKDVLKKFFGLKLFLSNMDLSSDGLSYIYKNDFYRSTEPVARSILGNWDQSLSGFPHA